MSLYKLHTPPPLENPVLIFGLAGWGDAASAASDAADWLAEDGQPIVTFDPDSVFDYRSNRPILRFSAGEAQSLTWPRMELVHVRPSGRDVLILVGNEPDYAWTAISEALGTLVHHLGVVHLVTLGSVPAPVRHGPDTAVFCTASDPRLLLLGDEMLMDEIVVPASAGTVFRSAIEEAGIPAVGYWAQVPQYVGRPYHPAVIGLLRKVAGQLESEFDLDELERDSEEQLERLDEIISQRSDAAEFIETLGGSVGTTSKIPEDLPTADEIADEVLRFLENPDES
ncbi:MAG: PAC2 family protein [Actinomycetota bacterium]